MGGNGKKCMNGKQKTFRSIHIDQPVHAWQEENTSTDQQSQQINEKALKEEIDKETPNASFNVEKSSQPQTSNDWQSPEWFEFR